MTTKDDSGTSLTEVDAVSVSVPTPQLSHDDGPNVDDECPSCGGSGELDCFEDTCNCVGGHPCPRCV